MTRVAPRRFHVVKRLGGLKPVPQRLPTTCQDVALTICTAPARRSTAKAVYFSSKDGSQSLPNLSAGDCAGQDTPGRPNSCDGGAKSEASVLVAGPNRSWVTAYKAAHTMNVTKCFLIHAHDDSGSETRLEMGREVPLSSRAGTAIPRVNISKRAVSLPKRILLDTV